MTKLVRLFLFFVRLSKVVLCDPSDGTTQFPVIKDGSATESHLFNANAEIEYGGKSVSRII